MQFKRDAEVVNSEGKKIGEVDRVVIDPKTRKMTDLVVRKGVVFTEDKVVSLEQVADATEEQVRLKKGVEKAEDLPDFRETEYVPMDDPDSTRPGYAPTLAWYYNAPGLAWWGYPGYSSPPPYIGKTETNIPEGTIALAEGSKVYSRDGADVGVVDRVYVDEKDRRASHIEVLKGIFSKERKLIPTAWIEDVTEEEVHLAVNKAFLDRLPTKEAA